MHMALFSLTGAQVHVYVVNNTMMYMYLACIRFPFTNTVGPYLNSRYVTSLYQVIYHVVCIHPHMLHRNVPLHTYKFSIVTVVRKLHAFSLGALYVHDAYV